MPPPPPSGMPVPPRGRGGRRLVERKEPGAATARRRGPGPGPGTGEGGADEAADGRVTSAQFLGVALQGGDGRAGHAEEHRAATVANFHNRGLERIAGLDRLTNLRVLDLSFNKLTAIVGLGALRRLRELKLYNNKLTAIEGLEALAELQVLRLEGNAIASVAGLGHLKQLKVLSLAHNALTTLRGLGNLCALEKLDAAHNRLEAIDGVEGCMNVQVLQLDGNCIGAVQGLFRLGKLEELSLNRNRLRSLKGLKQAAKTLDALHISWNGLADFSTLPELRGLTELYASENGLTSLAALAGKLPALEILDVSHNRLASAETLGALADCEGLADLRVAGNPLQELHAATLPERVKAVLPRLRLLEDQALDAAADGGGSGGADFEVRTPGAVDPVLDEMRAFIARMGIKTLGGSGGIVAMESATVKEMVEASDRRRREPAQTLRGSQGEARRPPSAQAARPSTPLAGGSTSKAAGMKAPLMAARPRSARAGGGQKVMSSQQYEMATHEFSEQCEDYRAEMRALLRDLRQDLALTGEEAAAQLRAAGGELGDVKTARLPRPPVIPVLHEQLSQSDARRNGTAEAVGELAAASRAPASAVRPKPPAAKPARKSPADEGTESGGARRPTNATETFADGGVKVGGGGAAARPQSASKRLQLQISKQARTAKAQASRLKDAGGAAALGGTGPGALRSFRLPETAGHGLTRGGAGGRPAPEMAATVAKRAAAGPQKLPGKARHRPVAVRRVPLKQQQVER